MALELGFAGHEAAPFEQGYQTSVDLEMLNKLVDTFIERGFTYFDTALTYHGFKSEDFVREALVKRQKRDEYTLATKLPARVIKAEQDQERILNEQLERCSLKYFDYYLMHNIGYGACQQALKFNTFGFVQRMKKEGKIKNVGRSFYHPPSFSTRS